MDTGDRSQGVLIAGIGGAVLIILLFLPWASIEGFDNASGWQVLTGGDIYFLITGLLAIGLALTAGGVLLPGLTWSGATALLGGIATVLMLGILILDWPEGTSRTIWAFLALIAAGAVAFGGYTASEEDAPPGVRQPRVE